MTAPESLLAPLAEHSDAWADWRFDHWGPWAAARLLHGSIYLIGALLLHRVFNLVLLRVHEALRHRDGFGPEEEKRAETLLALLRRSGVAVLYLTVLLLVVSDFGIQIGPLLAGLGVVGVAVGFGAQYLVKDLITGAFLVFENQVAVGDVVHIEGFEGVVESMTLRTTRVRGAGGQLHIVPNGEIRCMTNLTRGWSRAIVEVGVSYRTGLDEIFAALAEAGRRTQSDSSVGKSVVEPPEVLGVTALGEAAVTVRLQAKTSAGEQWAVERAMRRAVVEVFRERSIDVPSRGLLLSAEPELAALLKGRA